MADNVGVIEEVADCEALRDEESVTLGVEVGDIEPVWLVVIDLLGVDDRLED